MNSSLSHICRHGNTHKDPDIHASFCFYSLHGMRTISMDKFMKFLEKSLPLHALPIHFTQKTTLSWRQECKRQIHPSPELQACSLRASIIMEAGTHDASSPNNGPTISIDREESNELFRHYCATQEFNAGQIENFGMEKCNAGHCLNKRQKSTAPGIPRRSPIQVLTRLDVA